MNARGEPRFTAHSAGSHPSGAVRPEALRQLEAAHIPTAEFRSKSWDEFAKPDAPKMDFVFTVCDNAANEVCPIWPGQPMTAHWGVADPTAVQGTVKAIERAYRDAFLTLERRISLLLSLPLATIENAYHGDQFKGFHRAKREADARCVPSRLLFAKRGSPS